MHIYIYIVIHYKTCVYYTYINVLYIIIFYFVHLLYNILLLYHICSRPDLFDEHTHIHTHTRALILGILRWFFLPHSFQTRFLFVQDVQFRSIYIPYVHIVYTCVIFIIWRERVCVCVWCWVYYCIYIYLYGVFTSYIGSSAHFYCLSHYTRI